MRTQEKLIYTNERGESIEFSPASSYLEVSIYHNNLYLGV